MALTEAIEILQDPRAILRLDQCTVKRTAEALALAVQLLRIVAESLDTLPEKNS